MKLGSQFLRRHDFALFLRRREASLKVLDVSLVVCNQFTPGTVGADVKLREECLLRTHFPHRQSYPVRVARHIRLSTTHTTS